MQTQNRKINPWLKIAMKASRDLEDAAGLRQKQTGGLTTVFVSLCLAALLVPLAAPVQAVSDTSFGGEGFSPSSSGGMGAGGGMGGFGPPSFSGQGMGGGMMGGGPGMTPPGSAAIEQRNVRPEFKNLGLTGMGIAIPASNSSDVHILRVGIATVRVTVLDEAQEVTAGILVFDDSRFSLKETSVSPERISAAIYQKDQKVGTLVLGNSRRAGFEIWSGEVALNDVRYNAYILQPPRPPTPDEYGAEARKFCEGNPAGCKGLSPAACDPSQSGCRAEIEKYCAANTNDIRCLALQKGYCGNNSQDVRCRNAQAPPGVALQLETFCQQKPEACAGLGTTREEIMKNCASSHGSDQRCSNLIQAYCAAYPTDPGCAGKRGSPGGQPPPGVALQLETFCQKKPEVCAGLGTTREEIMKNCSTGDSRCRNLIQAYCAAYPNDPGCAGKGSDVRGQGPGGAPQGSPGQGRGTQTAPPPGLADSTGASP